MCHRLLYRRPTGDNVQAWAADDPAKAAASANGTLNAYGRRWATAMKGWRGIGSDNGCTPATSSLPKTWPKDREIRANYCFPSSTR
jgi:hypothetical protein